MYGTLSASTYTSAIADYEKLNPNIKIVDHVFPFDTFDTLITSHMSTHDSSFALYEVDEPRTAQYASHGWLAQISSPGMSTLTKSIPAEQLGEVSYNGKVWALPFLTSTQLLYYNKALLSKAGITPPPATVNNSWTWQQLYAAALKLHQATGKAGFYFEQVNRIYQLQPLPQGLGGGPGVTGANGLTPEVDNAAWIAAMQWYQKCFATGVTPKDVPATETVPDFEAGQAGFFWGGPWDYGSFSKVKGLSFGVALTPHWPGKPTMVPTDSWAIGVNPYSSQSSQALSFIRWLTLSRQGSLDVLGVTGPDTSSVKNGNVGGPPASFQALNVFWTYWPAAVANLMRYSMYDAAIHRAHTLGWVQFELTIEQAFASIADGANVNSVLANAQSTLKEQFSRISP